jgi:hypothetical protein
VESVERFVAEQLAAWEVPGARLPPSGAGGLVHDQGVHRDDRLDQSSMSDEQVESSAEAEAVVAAAELPSNYFELYKLAVEMADRISARRSLANSFFLSVNTGVMALLGTQNVRWYLAAAGIVMCVTWWALLKSYQELNRAKFAIILAMETRLPAQVYGDEWAELHRKSVQFALRPAALVPWLAQYRELGYIERIVPWVFTLIYVTEIIWQASK